MKNAKKYPNLSLCIAVSMESDDFEGQKLEKLLGFARQFGSVEIQLGDGTLHAKTLRIFYPEWSEAKLLEKSNQTGRTWWKKNSDLIIRVLGDSLKLDEQNEPGHWIWTERTDYNSILLEFREMRAKDSSIDKAFDGTRKDVMPRFLKKLGALALKKKGFSQNEYAHYITGYQKKHYHSSFSAAEDACMLSEGKKRCIVLDKKYSRNFVEQQFEKYLEEEVVVIHFSKYWEKLGYNRLAYPNKITSALLLASKKFNDSSCLQWEAVKIRLKNEKGGDAFQHMIVTKNNFYMSNFDDGVKKRNGKKSRPGNANCTVQLDATYKVILTQLNSALVLASMLPKDQKRMIYYALFQMLGEVGSDAVSTDLSSNQFGALDGSHQYVIQTLPRINSNYFNPRRYSDNPTVSPKSPSQKKQLTLGSRTPSDVQFFNRETSRSSSPTSDRGKEVVVRDVKMRG